MPDPRNIQLERYNDGTPSILRKKTVYTELFFYRKSDDSIYGTVLLS